MIGSYFVLACLHLLLPFIAASTDTFLEEATAIEQGAYITTFNFFPKEYSVSVEFYADSFGEGWRNILHFTVGGNKESLGDRIPGFFGHKEKSGHVSVCSAVNDIANRCVTSDNPIPLKTWIKINASQRKDADGTYIYQAEINGVVELTEVNSNPQVYRNVNVYASNPWYAAQDGFVKNLVVQRSFQALSDTFLKSSSLLEQGNLITTLAELPAEYMISAELYANEFVSGQWRNILHCTIGKNNGSLGDRIPGFFAHAERFGHVSVCSGINDFDSRCVTSNDPIPLDTWITMRASQRKDTNGTYIYQAEINGVVELTEVNSNPQVYSNVKVYASDPWYTPQNGYLRNLVVQTFY